MDDDLKLNHVPEPRARGGTARFLVLAVAVAAGLHLVVFGVLALSAHNNPPAAKPVVATKAPSAPAVATPAATEAPAASASSTAVTPELRPAPAVATTPAKPLRPAKIAPASPPHGRAAKTRHPYAAATTRAASVHRKPVSAAKPGKVKATKARPVKPVPKRAPAHKPAGTLDLDALSKFKSSGK